MDLEAMAEKYSMKDLRPLAKKMDIIKACRRRVAEGKQVSPCKK
jgi:hypothetical protein